MQATLDPVQETTVPSEEVIEVNDPSGILEKLSQELHSVSEELLGELKDIAIANEVPTERIRKVKDVFDKMADTISEEAFCWIDSIAVSVPSGRIDEITEELKAVLKEKLLLVSDNFLEFFPGVGDNSGKIFALPSGFTKEYMAALSYAADVAYSSLPVIFETLGYGTDPEFIDGELDTMKFENGVDLVIDILKRWDVLDLDSSSVDVLRDKDAIVETLKPGGSVYTYLEDNYGPGGHNYFVEYEAGYLDTGVADMERATSASPLPLQLDIMEIFSRTANITWKMQLPRAFLEKKPSRVKSESGHRDYDVFDMMIVNTVGDTITKLTEAGRDRTEAIRLAVWVAAYIVMKDVIELRKARKRNEKRKLEQGALDTIKAV